MRRNLRSILLFLTLAFFVSTPQLFAATTSSNGGGAWEDPNTWLRDGMAALPKAGDVIIISGADLVTISSTIDLSTGDNGSPTILVIHGTLKFFTPEGGCDNAACDIDLKLDAGSEVLVMSDNGIQQEGPGAGQQDIVIGNENILNQLPYGPGNLPDDAPLPIKLKFFKGEAMQNVNILEWQTEIEVNAKEFVLERSADGRTGFVEIGTVQATGISEASQNYRFEDKAPFEMSYYRLKSLDMDDSFEYSEIISLNKMITETVIEIFPLPVRDELNIRMHTSQKSSSLLTILNALGQVVFLENLELDKGMNQISISSENLGGGLHFLVIENKMERVVRKIF